MSTTTGSSTRQPSNPMTSPEPSTAAVPHMTSVHEIGANSVSVPGMGLDTVEEESVARGSMWNVLRKLVAFMGPGWLVAMAYLDPGNIEGDLQVGALRRPGDVSAGYRLLWVLMWSTAGGLLLQCLAVRLGNVTGKGLAELCRLEYSRPMSILLFTMTEIAIIGADFQAVIGSAVALKLLFDIPLWTGMLLTLIDTFTFLFIGYFGVQRLELLFAALIGLMAVCFWTNLIISRPDVFSIFRGLVVPSVPRSRDGMLSAVGLLGSVIMPHNLYLHSSLVLSRRVERHELSKVKEANFYSCTEAGLSLVASFLINIAVICAFANSKINRSGEERLDLYNAHDALADAFGQASVYIWAIGLLAAGQSATMTGTYAGQFVISGFFNFHMKPWLQVLITRLLSVLPLLVTVAVLKIDDLLKLAAYLNLLQAIQLPFALVPVLKFNTSRKAVGALRLGWGVRTITIAIGLATIVGNFATLIPTSGDDTRILTAAAVIYSLLGVVYLSVIGYLVWRPMQGHHCLYRRHSLLDPLVLQTVAHQPDMDGSNDANGVEINGDEGGKSGGYQSSDSNGGKVHPGSAERTSIR
ncbi:unnamed protein product [Vitrella brassicaformis CCMP3155]|uniref:Uncharacterized protein n=1 Tax=Vitrella brassicaformis (strain CCMP3155) TaxID=1169540 RepID=A0A0G4EHM7_VITBC|nr:unnamed protein product [Vitrella brassicaformis CCMP3155]|eukprot:CEL95404.1 unnamed protein product [Vitrella brassicaformis CCMP3155]